MAAGTRSMPAATRAPTLYANLVTRLPDGIAARPAELAELLERAAGTIVATT